MSDTRRDQLIDYIEKEFIGPDPIDWPGMTQSNGEEILTIDPMHTGNRQSASLSQSKAKTTSV